MKHFPQRCTGFTVDNILFPNSIEAGVKVEKAALPGCPFENLSPLVNCESGKTFEMLYSHLSDLPGQVKCEALWKSHRLLQRCVHSKAHTRRLRGRVAEIAPNRIWLHELCDLLAWYEANLCSVGARDPRDYFVKFTPERFPHLIKLRRKGSNKEVKTPQKQVIAIRNGLKTNIDFGGYDCERAQTFPWILPAILRPTKILELTAQPLIGEEKAGDVLYVKEFENTQRRYRFKILVCRTVGTKLLVPVTCHPRDHARYPPTHYKQVWPL